LDLNIPLGATNLEALVRKGELELKTYSYNSVLVSTQLYYFYLFMLVFVLTKMGMHVVSSLLSDLGCKAIGVIKLTTGLTKLSHLAQTWLA
jgi:hypothetical protein